VPYDLWARQGFIEATPGNVVDYSAVEARIRADGALFDVKEIAYDPWNATHIALRLQDEGAAMVEFRQGFRSMSAPTRELEKLIVSRKLAHGANPVTRWMAANVAAAQDPAGNLKPAKDKSTERIDGIVAIIMALGRAMLPQEPEFSYQLLILGPP
jgi:phage terminase large subunit-like protein